MNRLDLVISATVGITVTDDDSTDLSGSVQAVLDLTPLAEGVEIDGIRFNGGQIDASDIDFSLGFGGAVIEGRNLGGEVATTIGGFSTVTNGEFPTQDHQIRIDQGTLDVSGFLVDPASIMLANEPIELTQVGTGSIGLQQLSEEDRLFTFGVDVTLPIDADEMTENPEANLTATGTVRAVGQFSIFLPGPGDFNEDGQVDAVDYGVWREELDAGTKTSADYLIWRENYGQGQASSGAATAGAASVPEPASAGLLLLVLGLWSGLIRRRAAAR